MRLLRTKLISEPGTLEIEEFDDISIPQYAILSHRWGKDEPTLQDVERGTTKKGAFKKVKQSCDMAKRQGIDYIWIDTCCIDKTSSQELSEAINSMYLWYFKAHRCYAYLADVPSVPFGQSEWFTRGWTLQELLAPADLVFFDANWKALGTKEGLQKEISNCTGIPVDILSGDEDIETCSVAQRMSWAAKRSTKRVEDLAYCLLGIFGINMPLLYGEGERAFIRLQEEIMRVSDDHSLFAWESPDNRGGLLATSPAAYKGSGNIVQLNHVDESHNTLTISSRGVHLDFQLTGKGAQKLGLALLHCKERDGSNNQIAIYLTDLTGTMEMFQRVRSQELKQIDLSKTRSSLYLRRRACIRTGRIIPTRRQKGESNVTKIYEPHSDDKLENFINLAQPETLLLAAREDRQDDVWLMLTHRDIDINLRGQDEWPALFHAIKSGNEVVVKMLLARGADINLKDKDGYTPLMIAIEKGYESIVNLLLERGVDIIDEHHGTRPQFLEDTYDTFKPLPRYYISDVMSKPGGRVVLWAVRHQQESIIKLLLDRSPEADLKKLYGPLVLIWAAMGGYKGIAEWLIERGVEVDFKGGYDNFEGGYDIFEGGYNRSQTPLSLAAIHGHNDIVKLLIEKGANIEARYEGGQTPLLFAAEHGQNHTIELLLQKGARIDVHDNRGRTLLLAAAEHGQNHTIELLVEKGASIAVEDNSGRTLLSLAAEQGHNSTIMLLLEKGAEIEAKDNNWPNTAIIGG